jgi:hypothetical protein
MDCGHNPKEIIAADLRVGLAYRSLDGSIIEGTRLAEHNPEFICEGCEGEEDEWRWKWSEILKDYGDDSWLWDKEWPQWVRRPCERYYNWIFDKEPKHRVTIEEDSDEESQEENSGEENSVVLAPNTTVSFDSSVYLLYDQGILISQAGQIRACYFMLCKSLDLNPDAFPIGY